MWYSHRLIRMGLGRRARAPATCARRRDHKFERGLGHRRAALPRRPWALGTRGAVDVPRMQSPVLELAFCRAGFPGRALLRIERLPASGDDAGQIRLTHFVFGCRLRLRVIGSGCRDRDRVCGIRGRRRRRSLGRGGRRCGRRRARGRAERRRTRASEQDERVLRALHVVRIAALRTPRLHARRATGCGCAGRGDRRIMMVGSSG